MNISANDVFNYAKSLSVPIGAQDLMEHFNVKKTEAETLLECACAQFPPPEKYSDKNCNDTPSLEYLVKVITDNGIYCFFHQDTTWGDAHNIRDIINEQFVRLTIKNDISKERIYQLQLEIDKSQKLFNEKIEGFYANILTIMSVMISIFSLVIINANLLKDITFSNAWNLLKIFFVVDFPLVVCLVIFLVLLRLIVVNPLIKK